MVKIKNDNRQYQRYDTEMKVYFQVTYDIKTRIKFQVIDGKKQRRIHKKYSGFSRNIGPEGLCFASKKKLKKGDVLLLEVYAPNVRIPSKMEGEVRWSRKMPKESKVRDLFLTGVKLFSVNGKSVDDSIYYDVKYKVVWSIVLEAIFGNFKTMIRKIRKIPAKK